MRAFLCLLALLAMPLSASAQTYTDTFGSTTSLSSTSTARLKINMYTPSVDCVLQQAEFYVGGSGPVTVALFESIGGGTFQRIWNGSLTVTSTTRQWKAVTINEPLSAGVEYVLGIYISGSTVYYAYSNSSSFAGSGWGNQTDWDDFGTTSILPNSIVPSGGQSSGGYYQRLTIVVDSDADSDGWTIQDGDCDDNDPFVYPGATELCDGIDGNCDGTIPANEADADGDFWFVCDGDCDDFDSFSYPGAAEICDSFDNDCDGSVDEDISPDFDGDGYTALGSCFGSADDCNDTASNVNPGANEICDGVDNDCDGSTDEGLSPDLDGDGATAIGSCLGSADDCDDNDSFTYPGATEICDGKDNDCNGVPSGNEADEDGDDWLVCEGDCDDSDANINPGAAEDCGNGEDDNCNGQVDEDIDQDSDGYGTCEDCNDNDPSVNPGAEEDTCNGVDDDCDGALDPQEDDVDGDGQTPCAGDCDDDNADTFDGAEEICDGQDNDCDGVVPDDEEGCGDDDDDDGGGGGGGGGSRRGGCDVSDGGAVDLWWFGALVAIGYGRRRRVSRKS